MLDYLKTLITPRVLAGLLRAVTPGLVAAGTHYGLGTDADVTTAVTVAATGIVAWWSTLSKTPTALIAAVNSDAVPGVKVVSEYSPGATVTQPIERK